MSDYGIMESEIETLAKNARETMGGLFSLDPYSLSHEETVSIIKNSYK
jgi:alcohol dehydrogenase